MKLNLIFFIVIITLLFSCNSNKNKGSENISSTQSHADSMDVLFKELDKKNKTRTDSLQAIYPQKKLDNFFRKNDSVFSHILSEKRFDKNRYSVIKLSEMDEKFFHDNLIYYKYTGSLPVNDSVAFWIYNNYYKDFRDINPYFWTYYKKQKDTLLTINNTKFQYVSYYDNVYAGEKGITAYPAVLIKEGSKDITFFNFDTLYIDKGYLYVEKELRSNYVMYYKFRYQNDGFYLIDSDIAKDLNEFPKPVKSRR